MDILRFATAGSVDDGKSTLIGRLLYDTKSIFEDQLEPSSGPAASAGDELHQPRAAHRRPARRARAGHHDRRRLPLLRDAEAQVHHRGHPGPHPVHPQHGDGCLDGRPRARARRRAQGRRRAEPAARVPRVAAAGAAPRARASTRWTSSTTREDVFERDPRRSSAASRRKLDVADLTFIPVSALHGDNVVDAVGEHALVRRAGAAAPPRERPRRQRPQPHRRALPGAVRHPSAVATSCHDYRGYAGQVAGGVLKPGDEVVVLPSRLHLAGSRRSRRPTARSTRPSRRCR